MGNGAVSLQANRLATDGAQRRCGLPPGRLLAAWLPLIGRIDADIEDLDRRLGAQEQRIDQRFDAQDERIERGFDSISIGQQISSLDHAIDDRIEAYDYHHHVEDGAVVFSPSPRQK